MNQFTKRRNTQIACLMQGSWQNSARFILHIFVPNFFFIYSHFSKSYNQRISSDLLEQFASFIYILHNNNLKLLVSRTLRENWRQRNKINYLRIIVAEKKRTVRSNLEIATHLLEPLRQNTAVVIFRVLSATESP